MTSTRTASTGSPTAGSAAAESAAAGSAAAGSATAGSATAGSEEPLPLPYVGSLSPSRAGDFKSCPLLYRFRSIDRLPEPPSPVAVRGTLVHAVLEQLYDLPAPRRTLPAATALVAPQWARLLAESPELAEMFPAAELAATGETVAAQTAAEQTQQWLDSAVPLLQTYFSLEDPTRLEPAEREQLVEVIVAGGLRLRGFVDRLDVAPGGAVRVVDYKTGGAPREAFEGKALFQLKFYALVIWRTRGVVPRQLKLLYLKDGDVLTYSPGEQELERFERTLHALWSAIDRATQTRDFRPNPGRLCDWCAHQSICPAWGGTPPPFPATVPPADPAPAEPAPLEPTATDSADGIQG